MEKTVKKVGLKGNASVGEGPMPEARNEPEITKDKKLECRMIIEHPKYASIFDGHIGTMVNRAPIVLHCKEDQWIISQPFRPTP